MARSIIISFVVIVFLIISAVFFGFFHKSKFIIMDYGPAIEFEIPIYSKKLEFEKLQNISPESIKGQAFLVMFFASWCGHCKEQMIVLDHSKSLIPIPIIGIAVSDSREMVADALQFLPNPFEIIAMDNGSASISFDVRSIPEYVIIDDDGRMIFRHHGKLSKEDIAEVFKLVSNWQK